MLKGTLLFVSLATLACAQPMPRGMWWDGKPAQDLNLTEAQSKQIRAIQKDFRPRMIELRAAVTKAETDLQSAFDETPVDQKKANDAIEHLVAARADMFRTTSQLDLKLRSVLTAEQWAEVKKRAPHGGPNPRGGTPTNDWRRGGPPPKGPPPTIGQPQH